MAATLSNAKLAQSLWLLACAGLLWLSFSMMGQDNNLGYRFPTLLFLSLGLCGLWFISNGYKNIIPALALFVLTVLAVEALLRVYSVPSGLIPTPSKVVTALWNSRVVLFGDALVTFFLEALSGFALGTVLGIVVALLVVRFPFLEKGLMPYASIFSSIPIVALAPIFIKAFGLAWVSKMATVAVTVVFPVMVNVVRGLQSANPLHLDLMHSYAAKPEQTFIHVRIPTALPFFFNALKISTTLSLISAIVAEFFGTDGKGLGFRIQIEAGRFNLELVWAAIVVASVVGMAFFALINALEKRFTSWHVSFREQ